MPSRNEKMIEYEGSIADITTFAWEYSKPAGGDFNGTFNALPTYLVLLETFTELIAPLSEATSIANKESVTIDEARARLEVERQNDINKCVEHAQNLVIERFRTTLVSTVHALVQDTVVRTLSDLKNDISVKVPSRGALVNEVLESRKRQYKSEMQVKRGGTRERQIKPPRTDKECAEFARKVDSVHSHWESITKFFLDQDYESDAVNAVKGKDFFKRLTKDLRMPDDLLRQVFERAHSSAKEYSPQGLAMKHIYGEIYPEEEMPSYSTLRARYEKGVRLNRGRP
jgi:hypothetical protein